jgi:16S rRNA (cytidine1402-2'-O)-methyltransferase
MPSVKRATAQNVMPGCLYVVATPLGNAADLSLRAIETLRKVDAIICEDTRHTRNLLKIHGIDATCVSLPAFAEKDRSGPLLRRLQEGESLALVSDAGTPAVSDPGEYLVTEAVAAGVSVVPIPGPSAVIAALCASGLSTSRFHFLGFLPRQDSDATAMLEEVCGLSATLVLYEAPTRVAVTLQKLKQVLGDRRACLARELTKLHEEFLRGTLSQLEQRLQSRQLLGEVVLLIEGLAHGARWSEGQVVAALASLLQSGERTKPAAAEVAKLSGWTTQAVYKLALLHKT